MPANSPGNHFDMLYRTVRGHGPLLRNYSHLTYWQ